MIDRNDQAEALHLRAYHAYKMLKLVSLTSETKRILLDVESTLEHLPEMKQVLRNNVGNMTGWLYMEDTTAEVLEYLALEIKQASDGLLDLAFDRSQAGKGVQV